ncbi:MAG: cupin domain-containing protein [Longimicrobiales bacterium]
MSTEKRVYRLEKHGPADTGMPEVNCSPEDFASEVPKQTLHVYYEDEAMGVSVGVWTTSPMQEAFGPYPSDEFIWLLEGGFKMVDGNGKLLGSYQAGECVYFRNAAPVSWVQEEFLRKFYITYRNPKHSVPSGVPAEGAVKAVDPSITPDQMGVLESTDPFIIGGEKPTQRDHTFFTNDTNDMFVGMWDTSPFESEMAPFPCHEFVRLLEGEITITEEAGTAQTFVKDDVFFVPKGTVCSWNATGYVRKYYAMVSPAEK